MFSKLPLYFIFLLTLPISAEMFEFELEETVAEIKNSENSHLQKLRMIPQKGCFENNENAGYDDFASAIYQCAYEKNIDKMQTLLATIRVGAHYFNYAVQACQDSLIKDGSRTSYQLSYEILKLFIQRNAHIVSEISVPSLQFIATMSFEIGNAFILNTIIACLNKHYSGKHEMSPDLEKAYNHANIVSSLIAKS